MGPSQSPEAVLIAEGGKYQVWVDRSSRGVRPSRFQHYIQRNIGELWWSQTGKDSYDHPSRINSFILYELLYASDEHLLIVKDGRALPEFILSSDNSGLHRSYDATRQTASRVMGHPAIGRLSEKVCITVGVYAPSGTAPCPNRPGSRIRSGRNNTRRLWCRTRVQAAGRVPPAGIRRKAQRAVVPRH